MADLVGQTVGQYQIVQRLGRGGMADVYQAFHPGLSVYRALKVIRPEFVGEEGFTERFQREARAVAALRHPNIVQMHDFGVQDNLYYMVMEFIEGRDLKTTLAVEGELRPFTKIGEIIEQVASALSYAHQRGIVHRDIKPANIMLNSDGQAILTDFGIAKMLSLEEQMTQTGVGIGTPAYMAPEQARGETNIGPTADIYSLGIVIYEMLTGRVPFSADTPLAVMVKVMNDPIPTPRAFSPDIPDVVQGVILKATAKEPAQRYQTADALIDALKRSLDARSTVVTAEAATQVTPPPPPRPARRVAPWLVTGVVLAVLLCVLLAGVGVWFMWPRPATKEAAVLSSAEQQAGTPTGGSEGISEAAAIPTEPGSAATEEVSTPVPVSVSTAKEGELLFAQTLSGTVVAMAAVNNYTFEAAQGDSILVRMADPAGELAPEVQVFGPDGQQVCSKWQYAKQTLNAECPLDAPGQYTLLAGGHDTTGSYSLYVQRTNNPADAAALDFGATVSGAVDTMAGMKSYTFEAAQGDGILVRMADPAGELAGEAIVYGPDGQQVCSKWQYAKQTLNAECPLDAPGRYTLLVGGHDTAGRYNLTLNRVN